MKWHELTAPLLSDDDAQQEDTSRGGVSVIRWWGDPDRVGGSRREFGGLQRGDAWDGEDKVHGYGEEDVGEKEFTELKVRGVCA